MSEQSAAIAVKLASLREAYLARLSQEIADLIALAEGLDRLTDARPSLVELHQRLHKLAGSGGTFGLGELSQQTRALELTVLAWLSTDRGAPTAAARQDFYKSVAALKNVISNDEAGVQVMQSDDSPKDRKFNAPTGSIAVHFTPCQWRIPPGILTRPRRTIT